MWKVSKFVIAFVLTYLSGLAATLLVDVSWGIYLYQLQYFLNPLARWWYTSLPALRYSFIIAVVIFISFGLKFSTYSENRLFDAPQAKWLMTLAILMSVTSLVAVWPMKHSLILTNHLKLTIFLYIAYKVIDTPKKFERMIWTYLIGNFYVGWVSHTLGRTGGNRLEGTGPADTGGDGNCTAAILITTVPILTFYIFKGKLWQRVVSLGMLAFIMDAVVLINSRGAFLGTVAAFLYMILYYVISNKHANTSERFKVIGMIFIAACLFVYLTDDAFWERMDTMRSESDSGEEQGGGRMFFWKKTIDVANEYPLGTGARGFLFLSPQYVPKRFLTAGGNRAVHSTYFQCLAEYSWHGLFIFLAYILCNLRYSTKCRKHVSNRGDVYLYYQLVAITAGFIGYLAAITFLSLLYAEVLYWYGLFFACFGNIYMVKNHPSEKMEEETKQAAARSA